MGNDLIQHYSREREDVLRQIDAKTAMIFARDDKTLTDQDRQELQVLQDRAKGLTEALERVSVESQLSESAAAVLARVAAGGSTQPHVYARGQEGQALWDLWHQEDPAAQWRYGTALAEQKRAAERGGPVRNRAAEHMGTTVANTTPTAGGFDGLLVTQVHGPVIDLAPSSTPFLTLIGPRDVPLGVAFTRPRIVDPDLQTAAGPQAGGLEKGELPSKAWKYVGEPVDTDTTGNYINLSYQALQLPAATLQMVIDQLRRRTAIGMEKRTVAQAALTGASVDLPADADAAATQAAVWDAMAQVFINTGQPAEWIAGGPLGLAMLGSKVDLAGRPLLPFVGAANAPGTAGAGFQLIAPWGLQFAQTFAITDTTLYVGNGVGIEAYVQWLPVLQADEPALLGRQVAVAAQSGFYRPITTEGAPPLRNGVVKIAPA